jgi:hypothetical protein
MTTSFDAWSNAQNKELQWHTENQWRADDDLFMGQTKDYFTSVGIKARQYKTVIDAGCGPRLRSRFFDHSKLYAIDPLAENYMQLFPWCDLSKAVVYPVPLEQLIPGLHAEFLLSLNCLDHCRDFPVVIANIAEYADEFYLSYDVGKPDPLHPLILTEEISEKCFADQGLRIDKKIIGDPWRDGYSLNYWLSK